MSFSKVGFIGVGVMGRWMAEHCMNSGYKLNVFSRTASKCNGLVEKGAVLCSTPQEVAEKSEVVITMVGYPRDVKEVILGSNGVLSGLKKGGCVIDMTTSQPSLAVEISKVAKGKGISALDAPVSGGDVGAKEARLSIMVGGEDHTFEAMSPLFKCMGKNITYMGPAGSGQHTKMANQILIASNMVGVVEGLLYAYRAGLNPEQVIAAVSQGAAGSWSLSNLGPRILKRNLNPGFYIEHFIKDMEIALDECKRMNLVLPGLNNAKLLYDMMKAHGHEKLGTHALIMALEKMNNIEVKAV